jgi:hypothetical protein
VRNLNFKADKEQYLLIKIINNLSTWLLEQQITIVVLKIFLTTKYKPSKWSMAVPLQQATAIDSIFKEEAETPQ